MRASQPINNLNATARAGQKGDQESRDPSEKYNLKANPLLHMLPPFIMAILTSIINMRYANRYQILSEKLSASILQPC